MRRTAISVDDAIARNLELGIERAEISGGFCFFVAADDADGFAGFSGAVQAVQTPGGVMGYHCKAERLFGELNEVVHD